MYDVWRSGGNPDRIDYDRVGESFRDGLYHDDAAARELRAQRPKQEELEPEYQEYPDEQPDESQPT